MHGQVAARIQLTVLRDHNIPVSHAVLFFIQRFHSDIACRRRRMAVHGNRAIRHIQRYIFLRQDRIFCRHLAYPDAPLFRSYRYAAAGRSDGSLNRRIAFLHCDHNIAGCLHIPGAVRFAHGHITGLRYLHSNVAVGSDVLPCQDVARTRGHGYGTAVCRNCFAYGNTAVLRLQGHIPTYSNVFIYDNVALLTGLRIITASCGNPVRHMDVAVHYDHGCIVTGLHLAVVVDDNALAGFIRRVLFVSGQ